MPDIKAESISRTLEQLGFGKISHCKAVSGGCIATTEIATFENGQQVFVKHASEHPESCEIEAQGLKTLQDSQTFRVPAVLAVSEFVLVLEFIRQGRPQKGFWEQFGQRLSQLHQCRGKTSGFINDNFIGSSQQCNSPLNKPWQQSLPCHGHSWPEFFLQQRLRFQTELFHSRGHGSELSILLNQAEDRIFELLSTAIEEPSLLHGDLWSGNFLIDDQGKACLIDPAVYYGHRETDLAMTRLFGGFDPAFYHAYHAAMPMADEYAEREPIYQLYHVLNHLNLFGGGYFEQSKRILKRYV